MAYLTKEQYERRRENAAIRAAKNEEIAIENGATEEQVEAIVHLCDLRHRLHCNIDRLVKSAESGLDWELSQLSDRLYEVGLPVIKQDWLEIDTIDGMRDAGESNDETYDDDYCYLYNCREGLNKYLEGYLRDIDSKWGTSFCPTGALRIM